MSLRRLSVVSAGRRCWTVGIVTKALITTGPHLESDLSAHNYFVEIRTVFQKIENMAVVDAATEMAALETSPDLSGYAEHIEPGTCWIFELRSHLLDSSRHSTCPE